MGLTVTLADIQDAKSELQKWVLPSPLIRNSWISDSMGCEVYLKLENMQPIGSFKLRGATYAISKLSRAQKRRGVIAASAGNHAQGVAWASKQLGVKALIVMPLSAPIVKVQNTRNLGAEILLHGESYHDAFQEARKIARKTGRVFIHAFEDAHIIAGQGTVGLEILEDLPDVDAIISSVGGGGILAGIACVMKDLKPSVKLFGCQAQGAPSMALSLKKGRAVKLDRVDTFADGVAISQASESLRKMLVHQLTGFVLADDEEIAASVLTLLEKAKTVAEGSGALPLAALEKIKGKLSGKKVVLIISGGNIDVNVLSRIIDRGLIRAGRRVRVNAHISDRPGSLARLTDLIAREGANVIQAIHDRSEPSTMIDQTDVALTLETRGPEHSAKLIRALRNHAIRLDFAH